MRPNIGAVRFGFHVSMAGGFRLVPERARRVGCETIQLFTRSPRGWRAKPLDGEDVAAFRSGLADSGIAPVFGHAPYLPNLAADDPGQADRSVGVLVEEADRCRALGINYLIVHVGRAGRQPEEPALRAVAGSINRILSRSGGVTLLIENTAGMGSEVGWRFEQLAAVLGLVADRDRAGVVLDTAHLFEAGYDLATPAGLDDTLRSFDRLVGFGRLHLLHLNDSRTERGSRVDRHWHIGKGKIGREGFRRILNHPLLRHLPAIMETPRRSPRDDLANLRAVRRLVR